MEFVTTPIIWDTTSKKLLLTMGGGVGQEEGEGSGAAMPKRDSGKH